MSLSAPTIARDASISNGQAAFYPQAPDNFEEAGLNPAMIESLVLKFLVQIGTASGRVIAAELGLPFGPFPDFLRLLKNQQIVAYTNSASLSDYLYSLTDTGRARAKMYLDECGYVGPAPVPFEDYLASVAAQTITSRATQGSRPAASLLRPADRGRDVPAARPGDQLGPRHVPLWLSRQRQDQHRRADHPLLRHDRLDPQGAHGRRPDHQALRHGQPRADRDPKPAGPARRVQLRPPLDPDQAPDDRRRRRAADGRPRDPLRPR